MLSFFMYFTVLVHSHHRVLLNTIHNLRCGGSFIVMEIIFIKTDSDACVRVAFKDMHLKEHLKRCI